MTSRNEPSDQETAAHPLIASGFCPLTLTKERIISICDKPKVNPLDLNRIIHLDPALFCETLFAFKYFFPEWKGEYLPIAKIITVLHLNTVRNYIKRLALNASSLTVEAKKKQENFFKLTFARAYASRILGEEAGVAEEKLQYYYAAGLLFDFRELYPGAAYIDAVKFSEMWDFCAVLRDALVYKDDYKNYSGKYRRLLRTATAADALARDAVFGEKTDHGVFDSLRLNAGSLDGIKKTVTTGLEAQLDFIRRTA
ncbi:MAG: hypothetical protein LBC53_00955 [Spirochaetaceae bacterium]|jgi:hypothetical protein|nr:hypothetical protein [Spirochaetaceae bacterium]